MKRKKKKNIKEFPDYNITVNGGSWTEYCLHLLSNPPKDFYPYYEKKSQKET